MNERQAIWIAITDDKTTRLLRGWASGSGRQRRVRLEKVDELVNAWVALEQPPGPRDDDPERGSLRLGRLTEFRQRYAGEIARWLPEVVRQHGIDGLELFAPPRLTVMLRREMHPDLSALVVEHRVDVGNLSLDRLEISPEISGLFQRAAG